MYLYVFKSNIILKPSYFIYFSSELFYLIHPKAALRDQERANLAEYNQKLEEALGLKLATFAMHSTTCWAFAFKSFEHLGRGK